MIIQTHYLGDNCPGGHLDEEVVFQALVALDMEPDKARELISRLVDSKTIKILNEPQHIIEYYNNNIMPIQTID